MLVLVQYDIQPRLQYFSVVPPVNKHSAEKPFNSPHISSDHQPEQKFNQKISEKTFKEDFWNLSNKPITTLNPQISQHLITNPLPFPTRTAPWD